VSNVHYAVTDGQKNKPSCLLKQAEMKKRKQATRQEEEEDEGVFEVERIVAECTRKDGVPLFLLKWRGYPDSDNTWEPEEQLDNCPLVLRTWRRKNGGREPNKNSSRVNSASKTAEVDDVRPSEPRTAAPAKPRKRLQLDRSRAPHPVEKAAKEQADTVVGAGRGCGGKESPRGKKGSADITEERRSNAAKRSAAATQQQGVLGGRGRKRSRTAIGAKSTEVEVHVETNVEMQREEEEMEVKAEIDMDKNGTALVEKAVRKRRKRCGGCEACLLAKMEGSPRPRCYAWLPSADESRKAAEAERVIARKAEEAELRAVKIAEAAERKAMKAEEAENLRAVKAAEAAERKAMKAEEAKNRRTLKEAEMENRRARKAEELENRRAMKAAEAAERKAVKAEEAESRRAMKAEEAKLKAMKAEAAEAAALSRRQGQGGSCKGKVLVPHKSILKPHAKQHPNGSSGNKGALTLPEQLKPACIKSGCAGAGEMVQSSDADQLYMLICSTCQARWQSSWWCKYLGRDPQLAWQSAKPPPAKPSANVLVALELPG